MPRLPFDDPPVASDEPLSGEGLHDLPPELGDEEFDVVDIPRGDEPLRAAGNTRARMLVAGLVAAAVTLAAGALVGYRIHHRRAVLRDGLARANALVRLDTAAGYRGAASLLEPLAQLDPLEAGAARAFALAMLAADYRDVAAGRAAEALLVEPMRADEVPARASAAAAALALGRREAGDAMTAAMRAGGLPEARVIAARIALLAGNVAAAAEPVTAAAEAGAPAALALRGDVLRRTRQDLGAARAAYGAALSASPTHPRATYGLAKLALAGHATSAEAEVALRRLLADVEGTPAAERGRAALHLAALRLRNGDRAGAGAALDAATLDTTSRSWAERAAAVAAAAPRLVPRGRGCARLGEERERRRPARARRRRACPSCTDHCRALGLETEREARGEAAGDEGCGGEATAGEGRSDAAQGEEEACVRHRDAREGGRAGEARREPDDRGAPPVARRPRAPTGVSRIGAASRPAARAPAWSDPAWTNAPSPGRQRSSGACPGGSTVRARAFGSRCLSYGHELDSPCGNARFPGDLRAACRLH